MTLPRVIRGFQGFGVLGSQGFRGLARGLGLQGFGA